MLIKASQRSVRLNPCYASEEAAPYRTPPAALRWLRLQTSGVLMSRRLRSGDSACTVMSAQALHLQPYLFSHACDADDVAHLADQRVVNCQVAT